MKRWERETKRGGKAKGFSFLFNEINQIKLKLRLKK